MSRDNFLNDSQADSRSAIPGIAVQSREDVEYRMGKPRLKADPIIRHRDHKICSLKRFRRQILRYLFSFNTPGCDENFRWRVGIAILQSIADQVLEQLLDLSSITADRWKVFKTDRTTFLRDLEIKIVQNHLYLIHK